MIFEDCYITFMKDYDEDYKYLIQVDNKNKDNNDQNQDNQFYLIIEEHMVIEKFINRLRNQNIIGFQWKFEDCYLQLLFDGDGNNDSDKF